MLIIIINIHVIPGFEEAFKQASVQNASNSIKEPGIIRFDLVQQTGDLTRFALIEIYQGPEAIAKHRETAHYLTWREVVDPMMAEPRTRSEYSPIFPSAADWK